ncbi:MAG: methyltransferase domain-containing protein [Paracoccaceae bacterium]
MTQTATQDWNPEAYSRFRGLRLRPALDLLAQIGPVPKGPVVDLGCGNGAVGQALATRFGQPVVGVDSSPAMLATAALSGFYAALIETDIKSWNPQTPAALIFSNAALHWLADHEALMVRLAGSLATGGVLAVQMPRQFFAPSHRFLRDIAQAMFPDRFDFTGYEAPVQPANAYWQMLSALGAVEAWETEYVQHLGPATDAHPVRRFTESTAMRPFMDALTDTEAAAFAGRYDAALVSAYPLLPDGSALLPFRRVFFTLKV